MHGAMSERQLQRQVHIPLRARAPRCRLWRVLCSFGLLLCSVFLFITELYSATAAGTIIRNQASASYRDASGTYQTATSNIVETLVQAVPGFELQTPRARDSSAGQQVYLSHTLSNTGNTPDSYSLQVDNQAQGDDFDFADLFLYADLDQDGSPDSNIPLTTTPLLSAGETFHFVVGALLPKALATTDVGQLVVTAVSDYSGQTGPVLSQSNTDVVTVSDAASIIVTKSINQLQGPSPSGSYRVSLHYQNTGNQTISDLVLLDSLPAGMSYVPDSARTDLAPGVVLTDFDPTDDQGSTGLSIVWCAYDTSCVGLPISQSGSQPPPNSTGQATVVLAKVPAGSSASIWFDVTIDQGVVPGILDNTAEFEYQSAPRQNSNTVSFNVTGTSGVIANGSLLSSDDLVNEPVSAVPSADNRAVIFNNYIWNTGDRVDTFDIEIDENSSTFPVNSYFSLLHGDGVTPLLDTNGNSVPDTGPLNPGDVFRVVLRAEVPPQASGDNGGSGFRITKLARSANNPTLFNPVTDYLPSLDPDSVDLTNDYPLGHTAATGVGSGPEIDPQSSKVVTLYGSEGTAVERFTLFINNTGGDTDNYELAVSATPALGMALPSGWQVFFIDPATNGIVTVTGLIEPGASREIIAEVRIPPDADILRQSLFFSARSSSTGVFDTKHDEVVLQSSPHLALTPSHTGQSEPGGFIVYSHLLQNTGKEQLDNLQLSLSDSLASQGWQSQLYGDTNSNGQLDSTDQLLLSVNSLLPGESVALFVKVFAPATALLSSFNNTSISVDANAPDGSAINIGVSDITTITDAETSILKYQAADVGCDGLPDTNYATVDFDLEPGNNCVLYRLVATNSGISNAYNVVIHDSIPEYTSLHSAASCSGSNCSIDQPPLGGVGSLRASVPQLPAGGSYTLEFAVRLE